MLVDDIREKGVPKALGASRGSLGALRPSQKGPVVGLALDEGGAAVPVSAGAISKLDTCDPTTGRTLSAQLG